MNRHIQASTINISDENPYDRMEIADNPNTSPELLTQLSTDEDIGVRGNVARNPSTPIDILDVLSTDSDWGVRQEVAMNPNTSLDALITLGMDPVWEVRKYARVEYDVELQFAGMIGASEVLPIKARAGIDTEELWDLLIELYYSDLIDLLDATETQYLGDDCWEVTINFNGYIGYDDTYTVYADSEDEAIDDALWEAISDFTILDFKRIGR